MPTDIAPILAEARRLIDTDQPQTAVRHLRAALASPAPSAEDRSHLQAALARALYRSQAWDEALDAIAAALVIDLPALLPDLAEVPSWGCTQAETNLLAIIRARAVEALQGEALARVLVVTAGNFLHHANQFDWDLPAADAARMRAYARRAFEDYTAAMVVPQPVEILEARATALGKSGDHAGAAAEFQRIGETHDRPVAFARQGNALTALGDPIGAAIAYARYESGGEEPQHEVAVVRAAALIEAGQGARALAPARDALTQARATGNTGLAALAGAALGRALLATGELAEARRVLREALPLMVEEWGEEITETRAAAEALAAAEAALSGSA